MGYLCCLSFEHRQCETWDGREVETPTSFLVSYTKNFIHSLFLGSSVRQNSYFMKGFYLFVCMLFVFAQQDFATPNANVRGGIITCPNGNQVRLKTVTPSSPYRENEEVYKLSFCYGENNSLVKVLMEQGESPWIITYNPFKLVNGDKSHSEYEILTWMPTLNNSGCFSTMDHNTEGYYGVNYQSSDAGNSTFTYDSDGHLVKIFAQSSGTEKYNGEVESIFYTQDITYTWENGKIMKITCALDYPGESYAWTATFDYANNKYPNPCGQFPQNLWEYAETDFAPLVGYFGKGPDYLPSSVTYSGERGNFHSPSYQFRYTFNANGTLASSAYSRDGNAYVTSIYEYEKVTSTGIADIYPTSIENYHYYNLGGVELIGFRKGLNIVKLGNSVRKVVVK